MSPHQETHGLPSRSAFDYSCVANKTGDSALAGGWGLASAGIGEGVSYPNTVRPRVTSPEQVLCVSHVIISRMPGGGCRSNPVLGIRRGCLNPAKVTQFKRLAGNLSAARACAYPLGVSASPL